MWDRVLRARGGERGSTLVLVALMAPVFVALLIYVIDVNNWNAHKRHLQVQADAAALAAAQGFQPCNNANIYSTAGEYSGASSVTTPSGSVTSATGSGPTSDPVAPFNKQLGSTPDKNLHVLINSKTFYNQPTTSLPKTPDDTTSSDPCNPPAGQTPMVDVKATETSLPWYFRAFSSVPYINAQARVGVFRETTANDAEALSVSDSAPVAARAYFVDEDNNGAVLASTPLSDLGPNAQGQEVWANPTTPYALAISKPHIGVVVALSGNPNDTTCGHAFVQCFDQSTTTGPSLLHIQGWSAAGTGTLTAPRARSVALSTPSPNTCTDAYFSNSTTTCTETISAWIDYGTTSTRGVTVKPSIGGTAGNALTPGATNGTAVQWTGTVTLKQAGANQVDLQVVCTKGGNAACGNSTSTSATITDVQRPYAAGANSGSIAGAWISEVGGAPADANSFEVCEAQNGNSCTHNLVVTVDVTPSLQNSQHFSDPTYPIRVGTSSANVVGCGGNASPSASQYRQNLGQGCTGPFAINTSDQNCTTATTSPYDCVLLVNGVKNGPFQQGLGDRIRDAPVAGTHYYCKNNWVNNNNGGVPIIPADDSRLITLFVMPYGSTDSSGNSLLPSGYVPVENFATFYVTGFAGDTCATDDPQPPNSGNAWVVGHFVKYINTLGSGGGTTPCALSALGTCVAILTR
jgi:Flp pilus assembly protein TadG